MEINAQFHLFQKPINQFIVMIALNKTNLTPEMTKVQDTLEMTDEGNPLLGVILTEIILKIVEQKVKSF